LGSRRNDLLNDNRCGKSESKNATQALLRIQSKHPDRQGGRHLSKKKSKSKRSKRRSPTIWLVISLIMGGGLGGYFNPDWPVIGPLVRAIKVRLDVAYSENEPQSPNLVYPDQNLVTGQSQPPQPNNTAPSPAARPADKLLISSFNIQVFGVSKMAKSDAMSVIVQVIRQFDIVAIQEIRAKDDDILPKLIAMLNADGSRYAYLIGPRLGRTVSTEQYAYVYDTNRVEHEPNSVGTIRDPADLLHREPFVARFRARTSAPDQAFTFWLVNTHTDPDEVSQEVAALSQVFQVMRSAGPAEDDVILLGDLNANEYELGPIASIPGINWVVRGGVMTNVRQNKAYDNIIFHGPSTSEYTGRWGVFDFEKSFRLTRRQALEVSDHFPVWAEFGIWEGPPPGRFADVMPADVQ
jgi:deoxyribonuclease-1-like protein